MITYGQMDHHTEFLWYFLVKFLQSLSQRHKSLSHGNTLLQAMGKLMELVIKLMLLLEQKLWVKGVTESLFSAQSSNDFSKAAEQLLNKTEVIHISQEEISSRISEVIDWSLKKSQLLGLGKKNIHIVTSNDGNTYGSSILVVKKWQNSPTRQMKA